MIQENCHCESNVGSQWISMAYPFSKLNDAEIPWTLHDIQTVLLSIHPNYKRNRCEQNLSFGFVLDGEKLSQQTKA